MKTTEYENYIGLSRWTNASKSMAVHISNIGGNPLCGKNYKCGASDRRLFNLSEITCIKCKRLIHLK